jgi:uncharacterized phage protein (TIGR01671 family)
MREIIFRGRHKTGDWLYGDLMTYAGEAQIWSLTDNGKQNALVDRETVGQFTGVCDKNERQVFEGDIVRTVSRFNEANGVVIFEDGEFKLVLVQNYKPYRPGCGSYPLRCFDRTVVGNIHDNPELLEEWT